ncbi:MAG: polynucleotide adenylyltransferase PcnB, partial [Spirochaetaceae bacterium]|nr:polynucleotide adenylyltransferase PcnB [Spirochaetaceae bacterium]
VVYSQNEHGIALENIDADAVAICRQLQKAGYETYIVGGAVRDLLMRLRPKDFDLATCARPPEIKRLIRNSRLIGKRFKLVHVFYGSKIIELATFRSTTEGTTGNTFGKIEEDVMRRDFTMNALFYDPVGELVIDYVGGVEDIKNKLVKPIIPLGVIFKDDPVRMIRAAKYCAIAGWELPPALYAKIRANCALIKTISPSRLTEEITKFIKSDAAGTIAQSLEDLGLYAYLQPAASALMQADRNFRDRYLARLGEHRLGENSLAENQLPAASAQADNLAPFLYGLVADYLEQSVDWAAVPEDVGELYKTVFAKARAFILPMNPPRACLERVLRGIFQEHGISLKKTRLLSGTPERRGRRGGRRRRGGKAG